jgi:hypothetical protein
MAQIAGRVKCKDCGSILGVPVICFGQKQPVNIHDAATSEVTEFIHSSEIPGLAATITIERPVSGSAKRSFEDFSKNDGECRSSFISKSTRLLRIIDPVSGNPRKLLMMDNFPMSEGRRLGFERRRVERHKISSKDEEVSKEYDIKGELFPQDKASQDNDHDEEEERTTMTMTRATLLCRRSPGHV